MKRRTDQNNRIWGLVSELARRGGLSKDEAKNIMHSYCRDLGQSSSSALSTTQADALIERLRENIDKTNVPESKNEITKKQQDTLKHLYVDAGIRDPKAFCQRIIKKAWPQTRIDGIKMHSALCNMLCREYPRDKCLSIVSTLKNSPKLNTWEKGFIADLTHRFAGKDKDFLTAGRIGKLLEVKRRNQ